MSTVSSVLEACSHAYRIEYRDQARLVACWFDWRPLSTATYLDLEGKDISPMWSIWNLLDSLPDRLVSSALEALEDHLKRDIRAKGGDIRFELRAVAIED